jgi:hypothetical protein
MTATYLRAAALRITVAMRWIVVAAAMLAAPDVLAQPAPPAPRDARPAPPAPDGRQDPAELRRAGAAALEAGRLGEALGLYERALGASRIDQRVWFDLCLVRYSAGDYGRALNACYRALPDHEARVRGLLQRIGAAMRASGVRAGPVFVPDPEPRWYSPDSSPYGTLTVAALPPERSGAVRALDPEPLADAGTADVIAAARLDRLRGRRPALPYHVASRPDDYGVGLDTAPRGTPSTSASTCTRSTRPAASGRSATARAAAGGPARSGSRCRGAAARGGGTC